MTDLGVLGGTFDPVHNGHLQLADAALGAYQLDGIVFVPAGRPPHKSNTAITAAEHRLHMLRLAVRKDRRYQVTVTELLSCKPTYTFDTLNRLQEQSGEATRLHFILGHDAFLEIETWYRWKTLLTTRSFIIAVRPGYPIDGIEELLVQNNFSPQSDAGNIWREITTGNIIRILSGDISNISSTEIRNRIAGKREWRDLVPEAVGDYIVAAKIYQPESGRYSGKDS